jgi:hypothetical protein
VLGRDLEIAVADVAIQVFVLDAHVGKADVLVLVRQVVLVGPRLDLFAASVRAPVAVAIAPIVRLEEALVVALQLAIELHPQDVGLLLTEPFRFLQVRAIELGVVRPLACAVGTGVEGLATVVVAVAPVVVEEVPASGRQKCGPVAAVERDPFDQPLLLDRGVSATAREGS